MNRIVYLLLGVLAVFANVVLGANHAPFVSTSDFTYPTPLSDQISGSAGSYLGFGTSMKYRNAQLLVSNEGSSEVYLFNDNGAGNYSETLIPLVADVVFTTSRKMAIGNNGEILVRVALEDVDGQPNYGVFALTPSAADNYTQTLILPFDGADKSTFGSSLVIDENGNYFIGVSGQEGTPAGFDGYTSSVGAIFIVKPSGGNVQITEMYSQYSRAYAEFGASIALDGDGHLFVGAPAGMSSSSSLTGTVSIFTPTADGSYSEQILSALSGGSGDGGFGSSIAVNMQGTLVVGAPKEAVGTLGRGSIYVYRPDGKGGYSEHKLTPSISRRGDSFGADVDINDDGIIAVGTGGTGRAFLFVPDGDGGYTERPLMSEGYNTDQFGRSVALNPAGTVYVGASIPFTQGGLYTSTLAQAMSQSGVYLSLVENEQIEAGLLNYFDMEGDALQFALSGNDADLFDVGLDGALAFKTPPDFETPLSASQSNYYNVTLIVSDGELENSTAILIAVSDEPDTDNDGLDNNIDTDDDGDGVPDTVEQDANAALDYNSFVDSDDDGVPDYFENGTFGNDPLIADAFDSDGDGIIDYIEQFPGANDAPILMAAGQRLGYRIAASMTEQQFLALPDLGLTNYGADMAFGADGAILVGDPFANYPFGSAYLYATGDLSGAAELIQSSEAYEVSGFGGSVAIGPDGLLVISAASTPGSSPSGALYLYRRGGSGALQEQKLMASDHSGYENFGSVVAVGPAGEVIASAPTASLASGMGYQSGRVVIFKPNIDGNYREQVLSASDASSSDQFGTGLAISSKGVIVVGAPGRKIGDNYGIDAGAVYVYTPDFQGGYNELQLLASNARARNNFGQLVAISDDGTIAVGANDSVYIYTPRGDGYYAEQQLLLSDTTSCSKLALSVDAENLVINCGGNVYVATRDVKYHLLSHEIAVDESTNSDELRFTYRDPDGDDMQISLSGPDADLFTLTLQGEMAIITAPNFADAVDSDADNTYQLDLVVSDGQTSAATTLRFVRSRTLLKPVNLDFVTLGDRNGDGVLEVAQFGLRNTGTNIAQLVIKDPVSGETTDVFSWGADWLEPKLVLLKDATFDGVDDVALFGKHKYDGRMQLVRKNGATGVSGGLWSWPNSWQSPQFYELADMSGDGINEYAIFGHYKANGVPQLVVQDGWQQYELARYKFPRTWKNAIPMQWDDVDGDGWREIALFGEHPNNGKTFLFLADGSNPGVKVSQYNWPNKWANPTFHLLPDLDGDGIREPAVFGVNLDDGRPQLQIKKGSTKKGVYAIYNWLDTFSEAQFYSVSDQNGDGVTDFGVLAYNSANGKRQLMVKNAMDRTQTLANYIWPDNWDNTRVVELDDLTGDGLPELGLLGSNRNSGALQLQVKDRATRSLLNTYTWTASDADTAKVVNLGDVDGDGTPDVALYSHDSGQGVLEIYSGRDSSVLIQRLEWERGWY